MLNNARRIIAACGLMCLTGVSCGSGSAEQPLEPINCADADSSFSTNDELRRFVDSGCVEPVMEELIFASGVDDATLLEPFTAVEEVGLLTIRNAPAFRDMQAFSSLRKVNKSLEISSASNLESLRGLENLEEVTIQVVIRGNGALKNLNGLEGLRLVGVEGGASRGVFIESNQALTEAGTGLQNLEQADVVRVASNRELRTFDSLESLQEVRALGISESESLEEIGEMPSLERVTEIFAVADNPNLTECSVERILEGIEAPMGEDAVINTAGLKPNSSCADLGEQ